MGENQTRGGGVGGRSTRADAIASSIAKVWPLKRGVGNASEIGQKKIIVAHDTVQQLLRCDLCPHGSSCEVCSGVILHPDILEQQSVAFVTVIAGENGKPSPNPIPDVYEIEILRAFFQIKLQTSYIKNPVADRPAFVPRCRGACC